MIDLILDKYGFEVVTRNFKCEHGKFALVCLDPDGNIAFIKKHVIKENYDFSKTTMSDKKRRKYERIADKFLSQADEYLLNRGVIFCSAIIKDKGDRGFFRLAKLS